MKNITEGPELGQTKLSAGLDYYKPTMSQVESLRHPESIATFELTDRGNRDLLAYIQPDLLQERLNRFQSGWSAEEVDFLRGHQRRDGGRLFSEDFLEKLENSELPPVEVAAIDGRLTVKASGEWSLVTFWETIVMSELNELYFEEYIRQNGMDIEAAYEEGVKRLDQKISILKDRPDIKFADFGTRRRFSYRWHQYVVERLAAECPDNLIGTSNVWLANKLGVMPIGTFAHEMPMGYAALANKAGCCPLSGHAQMLVDWREMYDNNLSTALTDTFGSDFFFADFTKEQATQWAGLRHDSGDPFSFGETVIDFYENLGINPKDKTIVFSDSLDIDLIVQLADHFSGRINVVFGWGTSLTNDLGLPALNIVMKLVEIEGESTVKLSDVVTKHMGKPECIAQYIAAKELVLEKAA